MRILGNILLFMSVLSGLFAAFLYWESTYGSCRDGCPEGMVFILFMPAVVAAGVALALGLLLRGLSKRTG